MAVNPSRFLPATAEELQQLGLRELDIILVTGDSYIDSPFIGAAVIGRVLADAGFRVGILAQPDPNSPEDIKRLGEPRLFWGITGGSVDSMVANYTATYRPRKKDDYTPGGVNNRRPDRAVIKYANLIRQHFKQTAPLVLGGIEASLRRVAHYDAWSKNIRRSILFDAKADYLLYGMAEKAVVELADALQRGESPSEIRGLCYKTDTQPADALALPAYEECKESKQAFTAMFRTFYENNDPLTAQKLCQQHQGRFLVQNPPQPHLSSEELDRVHELPYTNDAHPFYSAMGRIRALDTIRFAVTTHRGCWGECNFCAIAVHQGRMVQNRSLDSIVREVSRLTHHKAFKGIISDVGGPTANMYGFECRKKQTQGCCTDKRCLFPTPCPTMRIDHGPQLELLKKLRSLPGIKKIFIASGIRYDMILADKRNGQAYLRELIRHHISGQMKIAPEHCLDSVLQVMGKPLADTLIEFRKLFNNLSRQEKKRLFLTYYIIAAHPGCKKEDMERLRRFARDTLKVIPRQVQVFTPTPSTWSTLIYWTGSNPWTGKSCFVERNPKAREQQKNLLLRDVAGKTAGRQKKRAYPKRRR